MATLERSITHAVQALQSPMIAALVRLFGTGAIAEVEAITKDLLQKPLPPSDSTPERR